MKSSPRVFQLFLRLSKERKPIFLSRPLPARWRTNCRYRKSLLAPSPVGLERSFGEVLFRSSLSSSKHCHFYTTSKQIHNPKTRFFQRGPKKMRPEVANWRGHFCSNKSAEKRLKQKSYSLLSRRPNLHRFFSFFSTGVPFSGKNLGAKWIFFSCEEVLKKEEDSSLKEREKGKQKCFFFLALWLLTYFRGRGSDRPVLELKTQINSCPKDT